MKKIKLYSKKSLATAFLLLSGILLFDTNSNQVMAEGACPSPGTIGSVNNPLDTTSFIRTPSVNGNCYGTPDTYGVTVYRMGLCTQNPAPSAAGESPDVSTCSFTYINMEGEYQSFAAGGLESLSLDNSFIPDVGSYRFAIIEIGNIFKIQDSYGPLANGTTYYTNGTYGSFGKSTGGSAPGTDYAETEAPLNSFFGEEGEKVCTATASETVSGGTISAYLLTAPADSSDTSFGTLIADNPSIFPCAGVSRLFGIMDLGSDNKVDITSATTGLTATFTVTDNGSTIFYDDDGNGIDSDGIGFDSGPFSVSFTTTE